ncbi:GNAT family protein [uncultured Polaribacter sp.]|uniref:GNAT family N-acetyltransferase n=1 Tax=uncultured Polaribacter sp. TaxID=174711 RepID=UPI002622E065|nr:GNAT family protein [uncultured Polaribacter sp.]
MKAVKLESERLVFLPLSLKHLSQEYLDWLNDFEVNRYLESRQGYNKKLLENFLKEQERKDILFWAIHTKEKNKHIGNIKIDPINLESNSGEYGILIGDKSSWGKGYAKEATSKIIQYCFDTLKLSKITLGVVSENKRAIKLYENLGFKRERIVKKFGVYDGKECDSIRMIKNNYE